MRSRLKKLSVRAGILLAAGLCYALLCVALGGPVVPCPIHMLTGLYCAGCGVSRMCLALLRLDLSAAFQANAAVLLLLPAGLILGGQQAVRYVRTGRCGLGRGQKLLIAAMVALLLAFGVVRNLPGFEWLRPV